MNKQIARLHYISQELNGNGHEEMVRRACEAGIDWVQLRVKDSSYNEWLDIALKTEMICRSQHARLIINDNVAIAKTVNADGVHLGSSDMAPAEARKILGEGKIIGGTANTIDDIRRLHAEGVDYIGLGPFRFTSTKKNLSPVLGLAGYEAIIRQCREMGIHIPLIAIGGIGAEDVKALLSSGMYGVAVSSAINTSENMSGTVKKFMNKIKFETEKISK